MQDRYLVTHNHFPDWLNWLPERTEGVRVALGRTFAGLMLRDSAVKSLAGTQAQRAMRTQASFTPLIKAGSELNWQTSLLALNCACQRFVPSVRNLLLRTIALAWAPSN